MQKLSICIEICVLICTFEQQSGYLCYWRPYNCSIHIDLHHQAKACNCSPYNNERYNNCRNSRPSIDRRSYGICRREITCAIGTTRDSSKLLSGISNDRNLLANRSIGSGSHGQIQCVYVSKIAINFVSKTNATCNLRRLLWLNDKFHNLCVAPSLIKWNKVALGALISGQVCCCYNSQLD